MRALWIAPPAVLIAGSLLASVQLRRISTERRAVRRETKRLAADRAHLGRVTRAIDTARASLDGLERR